MAEHTPSHFCETHCYGNVNRDLHISCTEEKKCLKSMSQIKILENNFVLVPFPKSILMIMISGYEVTVF